MNEAPIARRRAYVEHGPTHARLEERPLGDFRSAEERRADAALSGLWYRCRVHDLVRGADAIVVGMVAYCPNDECSERLLLAHSAMSDPAQGSDWSQPFFEQRATSAPTDQVTSRETAAEEDSVTVRDAVVQYLARAGGKARTAAEILAAVRAAGVSEDQASDKSVGTLLGSYATCGAASLVERLGRGRYRITPRGAAYATRGAPRCAAEAGGEMEPESSCAGTSEPEAAPPDLGEAPDAQIADDAEDQEVADDATDDATDDADAVLEPDDVVEEVETDDGLRVDVSIAGACALSLYVDRSARCDAVDYQIRELVGALLRAV